MVNRFGFQGRRHLAKIHLAAEIVKVGVHGQGQAKLMGKKVLGWQLAHVDAHANAITLFKIAALLDTDAAFLPFDRAGVFVCDLHVSDFAGTD